MPLNFFQPGFPEIANPLQRIQGPVDGILKSLTLSQLITVPLTLISLFSMEQSLEKRVETSALIDNVHIGFVFFGWLAGMINVILNGYAPAPEQALLAPRPNPAR